MHYDYIIEYEKRNPFEEKREYLSQFITKYLEYQEKQIKRRLIAPRTLDSDRSALYNFQRYIKHRYIKVKHLHRKDFEDYKEFRLDKDGIAV
jgi:site-specific recombinase XerD